MPKLLCNSQEGWDIPNDDACHLEVGTMNN